MEVEDEENNDLNAVAATVIAWHDSIRKLVETWTDERIKTLIVECEREALPDKTKNFHMPIYSEIAKQLRNELAIRRAFGRMREQGAESYCFHCDGLCTPEHLAELKEG